MARAHPRGATSQAPSLTFSNAQAERALLGYYLVRTSVDPTLQTEVLALDPDLFRAYRPVLRALQTVVAAGDPVDLVTVSNVLRGTDQKMSVSIDLVDMMEQAAVTPGAHRRILSDCLRRRRLDAQLQHLRIAVLDPTADLDGVERDLRDTTRAVDAHPTDLRFRLLPGEEMRLRPPVPWLVRNVIPAASFVVVSGEPGAGKTFVVLDLSLAVAAGTEWHGRPVVQGPVVYVAAEGQGGIPGRLDAWAQHHGREVPESFYCLPEVVLVGSPEVAQFVSAVRQLPEPPALIVFDTLSWCLGGREENASEAMAGVLSATRELRDSFGCAVLWVHHPSAAGRTLRGHTSLHGATDVEIIVTRPAHGAVVALSCQKMKNAPEFDSFGLSLLPIATDEGDPLSCVVVPADHRFAGPRLTRSALRVLRVLVTQFGDHGATFTALFNATDVSKSTLSTALTALGVGGYVHRAEGQGEPYIPTDLGRCHVGSSTGPEPVRRDKSDHRQEVQVVQRAIGSGPLDLAPDLPVDLLGSLTAEERSRLDAELARRPQPTTSSDVETDAEPCWTCGAPGGVGWSSTGETWCEPCWLQRIASA